jgi:hypothetical protein
LMNAEETVSCNWAEKRAAWFLPESSRTVCLNVDGLRNVQ